jgi:hypothetical protein
MMTQTRYKNSPFPRDVHRHYLDTFNLLESKRSQRFNLTYQRTYINNMSDSDTEMSFQSDPESPSTDQASVKFDLHYNFTRSSATLSVLAARTVDTSIDDEEKMRRCRETEEKVIGLLENDMKAKLAIDDLADSVIRFRTSMDDILTKAVAGLSKDLAYEIQYDPLEKEDMPQIRVIS